MEERRLPIKALQSGIEVQLNQEQPSFYFWRNACSHPLDSGTYSSACTRHSRAAPAASSSAGIRQ